VQPNDLLIFVIGSLCMNVTVLEKQERLCMLSVHRNNSETWRETRYCLCL